jgi:hypothetical protein
MRYRLTDNDVVIRDDGMVIPRDSRNRFWFEYQQWLLDGNTPDPAPGKTASEVLDAIYTAYEAAERANLTPAGAVQLAEWCAAGNVRALAVRAWLVALYAERDAKLDQVEGGDLAVDPTPSSPWKPWTFRQIAQATA